MRDNNYLRDLVLKLSQLDSEEEWVEFKINNWNPEEIAEYISSISNSATLLSKPYGYICWGIENDSHQIVGTSEDYRLKRKGAEELEAWLVRMITPKIGFKFYDVWMEDNKKVILLEIPRASTETTKFKATAFVRVGSNKKPLVGYKDKEAALWRSFDQNPHELLLAAENLTEDKLVSILDYPAYYNALELPIPANREKVMSDLENECFIERNEAGNWNVTNMGALLLAKDIKNFNGLFKRSVRVVWYKGKDRIDAYKEREFSKGYVTSYDEIVDYIMTIIPQEEVIESGGIRKNEYAYPEIAIRELVANTIIHQALDVKGASLLIELFIDRIEFSNPGTLLVPSERLVDMAPLSRNEKMAGFLHKCGICEERGSGYDKIVDATCTSGLIAPKVEMQGDLFTKATLYAKLPFSIISKNDRIWTCYMLSCLAYMKSEAIGNSDVRKIFGLDESGKVKASKVLKATCDAGMIKPVDTETAPRYIRYRPFWA